MATVDVLANQTDIPNDYGKMPANYIFDTKGKGFKAKSICREELGLI